VVDVSAEKAETGVVGKRNVEVERYAHYYNKNYKDLVG
jgi:hypothetical protein